MKYGKVLRSSVKDGEHPYTILNGCVWHIGTRVCSSGGCYVKACPEPVDIATVSIDQTDETNLVAPSIEKLTTAVSFCA